MCTYCMVLDAGRITWPPQPITPTVPYVPTLPQLPLTDAERIELDSLRVWKKMADLAKQLDTLTKQADCEDPEKVVTMERLTKRMDELEKRLDQRA